MLFPSILSTLSLSLLASVALGQNISTSAQKTCPFGLTKYLTATINVGPVLAPIPIPGGIRVVETYIGGKVTGSGLNGTILGGVGTPRIYGQGTSTFSDVLLYGATDDGNSFLIQAAGNGNGSATFSRIQIEIGGKYASYSNNFYLGSLNISVEHKPAIKPPNQPLVTAPRRASPTPHGFGNQSVRDTANGVTNEVRKILSQESGGSDEKHPPELLRTSNDAYAPVQDSDEYERGDVLGHGCTLRLWRRRLQDIHTKRVGVHLTILQSTTAASRPA